MLSIENIPPDPCHISLLKSSSSDERPSSDNKLVDLSNSDLDDNNNNKFSIRDYVFRTRRKDIKTNWPFSQKNLQLCLRHGAATDLLPPFQSDKGCAVDNCSTDKDNIVTSAKPFFFVSSKLSQTMANRRCLQTLTHHLSYLLSPNPSLCSLNSISPQTLTPALLNSINTLTSSPKCPQVSTKISSFHRHFSSNRPSNSDEEEEDESEDETDYDDDGDDDVEGFESNSEPGREYTPEDKEHEAAEIGYKVIGPLQKSDRVFKPYEPVYAVIQIGSHQFKVSNGDSIFVEKLKFCEVNDKLILNKVLLLGSKTQTIIGRPILPDAAVHAVVEEHALDAKVLIFKKKRRKNYRRTRGHRQELTKLRITDIQGVEKPEVAPILKTEKKDAKKVAVAA